MSVRLALLCAMLAGAVSSSAIAAPLSMQSDPALIAKITLNGLPGAAAAGVWRNGEAAFGHAPAAAAQDALFEIGSASKVFTGLLLAQAVEKGDLQLDDTVAKLLGSAVALTPNVANITLRQLVTHTSCLPRLPANLVTEDGTANPYRQYDRAMLWSALSALSLPRAAPCKAEYSNMGFAVLGELLAQRYAKDWTTLVEQRITGPLGMHDTVLKLGGKAGRFAAPHSGHQPTSQWDFIAFAGAGGLRSTPADMLLFSKAILAGGKGPLGGAAERLLQPLEKFGGGEIGYAIMINGPAERRTYSHGGATGGFRTAWLLLPDTKEALVVMASNGDAAIGSAESDILAARYGIATSSMALDSIALPAYVGVYRLDAGGKLTFVAQDGRLYGRLTGQPFAPLTSAAPDVFTLPNVGAEFTFGRDPGDKNKVVGVTLRQRGGVLTGKRTEQAPPAMASHGFITQETYGGMYVAPMPPLNFNINARAGQLILKLNEQPAIPLFPVDGKADRFAADVVAAEVQFERDASGKVVALVLHQNGQTVRAKRQIPAPLAFDATPVYLRGSMNSWGTRDRLQAVAPGTPQLSVRAL
ncbi:MAG: serine hydrolase [Burkholderiaceae bacterium]|nr:serine hydrolase [Burkholderiaceae bacterium]